MKIVYLIAGLYRPAGMERVLTIKANALSAAGYEILFVTTEQEGRAPAFPLDPSIRTIDLGIGYERNNGSSFADKLLHYPLKQWRHRRRLTALLKAEKADVVVSTFCNDASFLPSIKDGSRKVLELHFSRFKRLQYARKGIWGLADRLRSAGEKRIASRFERFVVLTREDAALWGDMPSLRVIPNPRTFACDSPAGLDARQVIAAGRYGHQKGFDLLLKAWEMIPHEGWTLRIAGQGTIEDLLCGSPATLPSSVVTGPSEDMRRELLSSSVFALSSRYEGLPMILLEAQACGLPSVCFKCKCGPADIISDGRDGLLVEEGDVAAFAAALGTLISDAGKRRAMGAEAYRNSDKYDISKILPQWVKLFEELS